MEMESKKDFKKESRSSIMKERHLGGEQMSGYAIKEHIVKRKTPPIDQGKKILLIVVTVLVAIAGIFISPLLLVAAIVLGIATYFLIQRWDLEYEYILVKDELRIDKIMVKTKRKKVCTLDLGTLEVMAPKKSHRLDYYRNNPKLKVKDLSSLDESHKTYGMVLGQDGLQMIYFEPDEEMFQMIQKLSPRKVYND